MNKYVQQILDTIERVPQLRKYWSLRPTYEMYEDFLNKNYISNPVAPEWKISYPKEYLDSVVRFDNINIDDRVIMTGKDEIAIGLIQKPGIIEELGNVIALKTKTNRKTRTVAWEKIVRNSYFSEEEFDNLVGLKNLADVSEFAEKWEEAANSLFVKDNITYLLIEIGTNEDINAFDLHRFLDCLTFFYSEFCKENDLRQDENLTIKIRLQSKGKIWLQSFTTAALLTVAGIVVLSQDPDINFKVAGVELQAKSKGFLGAISDFLDRTEERRQKAIIFQDSIRKLNATIDTTNFLRDEVRDQTKKSRE